VSVENVVMVSNALSILIPSIVAFLAWWESRHTTKKVEETKGSVIGIHAIVDGERKGMRREIVGLKAEVEGLSLYHELEEARHRARRGGMDRGLRLPLSRLAEPGVRRLATRLAQHRGRTRCDHAAGRPLASRISSLISSFGLRSR